MNLRLLLWPECNRSCEYCCNKQFNLAELPVAPDFRGYGQILLTGGEPLLYPEVLLDEIARIKRRNSMAFIYLYTAKTDDIAAFCAVLNEVHGVTLTIHEQGDVPDFQVLQAYLDNMYPVIKYKSMRLRIRNGINMRGCVSHYWTVDFWEPQEVCPVPTNEVFMRLRA